MTLVWTGFIFINSLSDGAESSKQSGKVAETVEKVAEIAGIEIKDKAKLSRRIRKSAHFLEFGLLGGLTFMTVMAYKMKPLATSVLPIGYCLTAASADEYIQTFTPGRAGLVSDVLIDVAGASFAILLCLGITVLLERSYTRRKDRKKDLFRTKNKGAD